MLANFAAHLSCKLVVDGVSGSGSNDASLDGFADECHIADDVEQFVACTFIFPYQRFVLDISQFCCVSVFHLQHVGQRVEFLL